MNPRPFSWARPVTFRERIVALINLDTARGLVLPLLVEICAHPKGLDNLDRLARQHRTTRRAARELYGARPLRKALSCELVGSTFRRVS